MSATDWLLLIILSVLWGGSFYFAKIAVLEIPPLTLALGRVGIAAAALAVFARVMAGPFPRDRRPGGLGRDGGAQQRHPVHADVLGTDPHLDRARIDSQRDQSPVRRAGGPSLMTHDDRLSVGRVVGVIAGFAGVVMLIGPDC